MVFRSSCRFAAVLSQDFIKHVRVTLLLCCSLLLLLSPQRCLLQVRSHWLTGHNTVQSTVSMVVEVEVVLQTAVVVHAVELYIEVHYCCTTSTTVLRVRLCCIIMQSVRLEGDPPLKGAIYYA